MKTVEGLKHGWMSSSVYVINAVNAVHIKFTPHFYVEEKTLQNWFKHQFPKKRLTKLVIKHLFASHQGNVAKRLDKDSITLRYYNCGWVIEWMWR